MTSGGNIHATGLVLGRTGVILRGPSGSGKSLLALALLDEWEARNRAAKLVADDRLDIIAENGRLTMLAPKAIAGLVELRGRGIVERPYAASARVHLVVDLVPRLERMVEEEALQIELFGVTLTRCPVPKVGVVDPLHQLLLIREALRTLSTADRSPRQFTS